MRKLLIGVFLLKTFTGFAQTENLNYSREITVVKRGNTTLAQVDLLPIGDKFLTSTYLDGLQRPVQKINREASLVNSIKKDIVTYIDYDEIGREPKSFLPYATSTTIGTFKNDVATAQPQYFSAAFGESPSYATTSFGNSPLDNVTKTMLPGNNWSGSNIGVSADADLNTVNEKVHIWRIDNSPGAIPITSSTDVYPAEQLFKSITTDEYLKQVITYSDKSGNTILKKVQDKTGAGVTIEHSGWLCTYYVYDDFGQLRFIIPPKAVVYLDSHSWVLSADVINELCFSNEYDKRRRLIVKKSPGADPVYVVYDWRDRPVFTQDGNQRNQSPKKWMVTLFDNLDRVTSTGLIDYALTRDDLQAWVDNNTTNNGTNGNIIVNVTIPPQPNLVIDTRNANTPALYTATNSITFTPGFVSGTSDNFVAQIDATVQSSNNNLAVNGNPLPANNNLYTLTLTFYDDYSYTGAKTFSNNFTIDNSVPANETETIQQSSQTIDFVTGTKVRLLDGSNTFLTTSSFYDYKGRTIQLQGDNHKGFNDETTTQYDFGGKVRSTYEFHRFDANNDIKVYTHNTYDVLGRIIKMGKSINGSSEKDIASYTYNELGQLANKKLAPGFAGEDGPQLESLDYTYNIQGWLLGINKVYSGSTTRTGSYFGMELGYDKTGTPNFTNTQTNGNIAGNAWKTRGDNTIRKYDYSYDNENQLLTAAFNQRNSSGAGWTKDKMDFTSNYAYDENGNIKTQDQWGVTPGLAPLQIDKLVYHYDMVPNGLTNRLSSVEEQSVAAANGALGDFKNGTTGSVSQQYWYDKNANLSTDLNKEIGTSTVAGTQYNFMNLPTLITFRNTNKTLSYVYDAAGNKLRKIVDQPLNGSIPASHMETDYDEEFVYQTIPVNLGGTGVPVLQLFGHEEGRVRIITPVGTSSDPNYNGGGVPLPGGKQGVFDYFIKDNLTNVRMILTEEIKRDNDIATMEDANPNIKQHEESTFGGTANEVNTTRFLKPTDPCGTYSQGWMSNSSAKVSKLSGLTNKMGPNVILKVMSGDKISTQANYYYKTNSNTVSNTNLLNDIVTSLIGTLNSGKASSALKGNSGIIQATLSNVATSPLNNFLGAERPSEPATSPPKGYLNIIFFDEQFNYVNSYFTRVSLSCDQTRAPLTLINNEALKNGWCYIYLSNESDEPVYFDNFQVTHERGRIVEENHYYSYGLKINSISSSQIPGILNKYGYQSDFSENDQETALDEFDLRHYDPQIGRWTTTDPKEKFANPYLGMGNSPNNNIDPDGGDPTDWVSYLLNGVKHVQWFDDAIDQGSAESIVAGLGGSNAFDLGLSGYWTSTEFGLQNWILLSNGKADLLQSSFAPIENTGRVLDVLKSIDPPKPGFWQTINSLNSTIFHSPEISIISGIANDAYITEQNYAQGHTGFIEDLNGNSVSSSERLSAGVNTFQLFMAPADLPIAGITNVVKVDLAAVEEIAVHGNSLKSLKPTWGYKLYSDEGTFLKNGITSKIIPETRYTKSFMSTRYMETAPLFPNRLAAYEWEYEQNQILRGPLNLNLH